MSTPKQVQIWRIANERNVAYPSVSYIYIFLHGYRVYVLRVWQSLNSFIKQTFCIRCFYIFSLYVCAMVVRWLCSCVSFSRITRFHVFLLTLLFSNLIAAIFKFNNIVVLQWAQVWRGRGEKVEVNEKAGKIPKNIDFNASSKRKITFCVTR